MSKTRNSALVVITTVLFIGASSGNAIKKGAQLVEEQQYAEAIAVLDPAIQSLHEDEFGDKATLVRLLLPAAKAHVELGQIGEGRARFDEAFELLLRVPPTENGDLIIEAFQYRRTIWFDDYDRANRRIAQLESIFELAERVFDRSDVRLADMAAELGDEYGRCGLVQESEEFLRFARLILDRADIKDADELGLRLLMLGGAYIRINDRLRADGLIKRAQALGTSTDGPIPVTRVAPVYPRECRKRKMQGEVTLQFSIDRRGRPHDPRVFDVVTWRGSRAYPAEHEECQEGMRLSAMDALLESDYIPRLDSGRGMATEGMHTTISFPGATPDRHYRLECL